MKHSVFLLFLVLVTAVPCVHPFTVDAAVASMVFWESASVSINCTSSSVIVISMVNSVNASLVHFPSGVDMSSANLVNVTMLLLTFTSKTSTLMYQFNNTQGSSARVIADAENVTLTTAFQTTFTWNSTKESSGKANVTYNGPGKQNLTQYTGYLMAHCLASDLGGFSLTFLPFSHGSNAQIAVAAAKNSGGFNWTYEMAASHTTNIATGSGDHFIDVLALLKLDSVAPSPYASYEGYYQSSVALIVRSNTTLPFVSCQPARIYNLLQRGWYIYPTAPPRVLLGASFSFGNSPASVSPLTFTFSGIVIPEFPQMLLIVFLMMTIAVMQLTKRIRGKHAKALNFL